MVGARSKRRCAKRVDSHGRFCAARFADDSKRRHRIMGVSYIPVARVGELLPGAMKEIELGGRLVLLAFVEGEYFAFARQCPHEEADLKTGALEGAKIRCHNHNYCFDLRTGECVLPQGGPNLTVLAVEERGEEVCIRLEW